MPKFKGAYTNLFQDSTLMTWGKWFISAWKFSPLKEFQHLNSWVTQPLSEICLLTKLLNRTITKLVSSRPSSFQKIWKVWKKHSQDQNMKDKSENLNPKENSGEHPLPITSDQKFLRSSILLRWERIVHNFWNMDSTVPINLPKGASQFLKDKTTLESCLKWKEITQLTTSGEELSPKTQLTTAEEAERIVFKETPRKKSWGRLQDQSVEIDDSLGFQVKNWPEETAEIWRMFALVAEMSRGKSEWVEKESTQENAQDKAEKGWKRSAIVADKSNREWKPLLTKRKNSKRSKETPTFPSLVQNSPMSSTTTKGLLRGKENSAETNPLS